MSLAIQEASRSATRISSLQPSSMTRFGYTRVQIGIFNTGVNGTGGFSPTVSANLGAPNINISPNTSGIVLVGIVDGLTNEDRATEFTGDGGPFYFLSNNFHVADAVTVVKEILPTSLVVTIASGRTAITTAQRREPKAITSTAPPIVGSSPVITTALVPTILVLLRQLPVGLQAWFCGPRRSGWSILPIEQGNGFLRPGRLEGQPDLTLNLGLRYDIFTAPTERYDLQSNFVPATGTMQMAGDNAPVDATLQTLIRTTLDHESALPTAGSRRIRRLLCVAAMVCFTQPIPPRRSLSVPTQVRARAVILVRR